MVSVVIPTKNGGAVFERVLEGLRAQSLPGELDILVVDSGSRDQTLPIARRHGARILEIPPEDFNHGATRNHGIEMSKSEIVVLMTQDAVPANAHLLSGLLEPFADPDVAGVFARQVPRPDADPITRRYIATWITGGEVRLVRQISDLAAFHELPPMEQYAFCVFDNVCSAIRRSTWETIPFPRTQFGEDIEWGRSVLMAGWKVVFQPEAVVEHSHDRSILYEYRRTYICHRRLFQLFGIQTIPSLPTAIRHIARGSLQDAGYILKGDSRADLKAAQLLRLPFLTFASVWGQYSGARDERRREPAAVRGV